jgi:predicted O-methyltransferase YrrM
MRAEALPPRAECPEPGRWSAPDAWASEVEVSQFLGDLCELIKPDFVVETGSYAGFTSAFIGVALVQVGRGAAVSIEVNHARAREAAERCVGLPVTIVCDHSLQYVPTQPIDLLFVDSGWETRMPEVRRLKAWASPRCVVVCHDPAVPTNYPGVPAFLADMQAIVDEGTVHPWLYLPTPRGLALTRYR